MDNPAGFAGGYRYCQISQGTRKMSSTNDVVIQTIAAIVSFLKSLIDDGTCQISRRGDQTIFTIKNGSAVIVVRVIEHPGINEEALVEVVGHLAPVTALTLDLYIAVSALTINNSLNGYAIALDKHSGMLCLRGTLIGSTMDELEISYLLQSLGSAADELDDKFLDALSAGTSKEGEATTKVEHFKEIAARIQSAITEKQELLVNAFAETLSEDQRAEFAMLIQDAEVREAIRTVAFGAPAAELAALLVAEEIADEDRRAMAKETLDSLPEAPLLLQMLAFTVFAIAKTVAEALGVELAVVQDRVKLVFGQS
jgi:hypothetical protein